MMKTKKRKSGESEEKKTLAKNNNNFFRLIIINTFLLLCTTCFRPEMFVIFTFKNKKIKQNNYQKVQEVIVSYSDMFWSLQKLCHRFIINL